MAATISGALMAEKRARYTCWPATLTINFSVLSITCSPPCARKSHCCQICSTTSSRGSIIIVTIMSTLRHASPSADKVKVKDANIPSLVGLARSKQVSNQP